MTKATGAHEYATWLKVLEEFERLTRVSLRDPQHEALLGAIIDWGRAFAEFHHELRKEIERGV